MKNKIALILFLFFSSAASAQNIWAPPLIGGSTSWINNSNWSLGHFPTASEDVVISLALLNSSQPIIANGTAAVCKSLTFNATNGLSLTVNGTLAVSGLITQNPPAVSLLGLGGTVVNTITGTGSVTCSSMQVGNTSFLSVGAITLNQVSLISTVSSLQISGDLSVYGTTNAVLGIGLLQINNAAFYVRGGTTTVGGQLYTNTSVSPTGISLTLGTGASANIYVDVPSGSALSPVLKLTNATPIKSGSNDASIDFYHNTGTGTGICTVEYAYSGTSPSSQTIYTKTTTQLDTIPTVCQNVKFSASGTKSINSGDLTVYGDWTSVLGKVDAITNNPNIIFKGVTQSLKDTLSDGGNGVVFKNVFVQNSGTKTMSGTGKFSVSSFGILTMGGSATLATGGILTLISDASSTATVASIPSGTAITGNVNAQRYISGGSSHRGYRLLTSPVNNGSGAFTLAYLKLSAYVTGTTMAAGGFDPSPNANNPTIYFFRENTALSNTAFTSGNYRGVNNITSSPYSFDGESGTFNLYAGNGFLFFFRGNRSGTIAQATVVAHVPENTTFTATGSLNQGNITVKHWYTGATSLLYTTTTGSTVQGYNLVGNPYASTINFEKINRKGISGGNADPSSSIYISGQKAQIYTAVTANKPPVISMWVFNPTSKQYESYQQNANQITTVADTTTTLNPGIQSISGGAASNMIASGQGFFVRATAANQTMIFRESAKTNTQPLTTTINKVLSLPNGNIPLAMVASKNNSFAAAEPPAPSLSATPNPLMRLQLIKDSLNVDGVAIVLMKDTSPAFDKDKDTEDLGGSGALESLSVLSSDSVQIAIHRRQLPGKVQDVIRLFADATTSGPYKLKLTDLKDLPDLYEVWLKDTFLKDSVAIKSQSEYNFTIDKSNKATFGSNRLQLIVRQNPALMVRLLNFEATKVNESAKITWFVENEANYTTYVVERSTDNGKIFAPIGTLNSNGAKNYSLNDPAPAQGLNQYRLKQIDLNGDFTYSKIAPVMFTNKPANTISNTMSLYPNPATDIIHAEMKIANNSTFNYKISITNSEGKVIATAISAQANWQNNVASFIPGTYIMQVVNSKDNSIIGIQKFIKQ